MSRRMLAIVVAAGVAIASCSDASESTTTSAAATPTPTSSTSAPDPSPTSSPAAATSTTTPASTASATTIAPLGPYVPPDPFTPPSPTPSGGGSGCSPGSGSLPDGVWFGYVTALEPTTVTFDLACYRMCTYGEGHQVTNDATTERTVRVAPGAISVYDNRGAPDRTETYLEFEAAFVIDQEDPGPLAIPAWVYVNDGALTHVVWYTERPQCRSDLVEVERIEELSGAGLVGFNELGLVVTGSRDSPQNQLYWFDEFTSVSVLSGDANSGWERSDIAADGTIVGIGSHIHEWTGSTWQTWVFDDLDGDVWALSAHGDRVLVASRSEDRSRVHVLTRSGSGWDIETILDREAGEWHTISGAIHGDTLAIADTGIDSMLDAGTALIYTWDGTAWTLSGTLQNPRVWEGNWGSFLSLDQDRLVVGADGYTPGPGTPGGVYLYTRTGDQWVPEVVAEGREGFGVDATIDGDIIVAGGATGSSTSEATFWVFTKEPNGWAGTPIALPGEDQWIWGIDLLGDLVAVSTGDATHVGRIVPRP